jgi:hypothetical protein
MGLVFDNGNSPDDDDDDDDSIAKELVDRVASTEPPKSPLACSPPTDPRSTTVIIMQRLVVFPQQTLRTCSFFGLVAGFFSVNIQRVCHFEFSDGTLTAEGSPYCDQDTP